MRAVFVNYSHPDTSHVSALRAASFAAALTELGHQIVLLTKTLNDADRGAAVPGFRRGLQTHDWKTPLQVGVRVPLSQPVARTARIGLVDPLRKAVTARDLLWNGGVYRDWVAGASRFVTVLANEFKPDVVWAIFLPTDTLVVAKQVAREALCPWIIDFKDAWRWRLPGIARGILAQRFQGADGYTANSEYSADQASPWFRRRPEVVYDGISEAFLGAGSEGETCHHQRIVLVGSVYRYEYLVEFLSGFRNWLLELSEGTRSDIEFAYAGCDGTVVAECTRHLELDRLCRVTIKGYLPLRDLARLCRRAAVNAYLWLPTGFHHKVLDLLACGRPVIAFPGEHEEAKVLAKRIGGILVICKNGQELSSCLSDVMFAPPGSRFVESAHPADEFSWQSQGTRLARTFSGLANTAGE